MRKIKIENNDIKEIEKLKNLLGLNIKKLNVKGNPFLKDNINYKKELYDIFLSLICIDDCDKEGNEIESTEYGDEHNYFEEIDKTEESEEDELDSNSNDDNSNSINSIEENEIENEEEKK